MAHRFARIWMLTTLFLGASAANAENAISDLNRLSPLLIHHYDCRVTLIVNDEIKEDGFQFAPSSGHAPEGSMTISAGGDEIQVGANSQLLSLQWKRNGKIISNGLTMIQNSSTQAYVLISYDPENEANQANISCTGVTFADLKKAQVGGAR